MDKKVLELSKAIINAKKFPQNLRLFLITETQFIRLYYGKLNASIWGEGSSYVKSLRLDRGQILDLFSKLEFFINEFILLRILGPNSPKGLLLDDILENVDFFSRIRILNKWNVIDNALLGLLLQTKQVRNGFAHAWDESEVMYKAKPIRKMFAQFKKDMEQIWKKLLEIYKIEQAKIDIESIIRQLKEENEEL